MSYKDLIANTIASSDFTIKEIAEECKKNGVSITPSYISLLKSGKTPPPSEEVSRAIAKVCGIDENILVLEAYLDKAPNFFVNLLEIIKQDINSNDLAKYEFIRKNMKNIQYTSDDLQIIDNEYINKLQKHIKERTLAESLCEYYDEACYQLNINDKEMNINEINRIADNKNLPYMKINAADNAMHPLIPKNSSIYIERDDNYQDGDIICFIRISDNKDTILIRKYYTENEAILLTAINDSYRPLMYKNSEIKILGRVKKIIIDV